MTRVPPNGNAGSRDLVSPIELASVFVFPSCLYLLNGLLVQLPYTRTLQIALLPYSLATWYHAATQYALANPWFNMCNQGIAVIPFLVGMRMTEWAFLEQPLQKLTPKRSSKSGPERRNLFMNTLDLCSSLRGIDWVPKGHHPPRTPPQTRSTTLRRLYILQTILSLTLRFVLLDVCHAFLIYAEPGTMGIPKGGSIYDGNPAYSPLLRFTRATLLGLCTGICVLNLLSIAYDALALVFIGVGGQEINQWPPIFGAVWGSTSLAQLWNERWHQLFRPLFVFLGNRPGKALGSIIGGHYGSEIGGVLGAFAASGFLHVIATSAMGRGMDAPRVMGYFMLQAVGVILEQLWTRWTGRKVRGVLGWLWTVLWAIGLFQLVAEAWLTRGFAGFVLVPDHWSPGQLLVRWLLDSQVDRSKYW